MVKVILVKTTCSSFRVLGVVSVLVKSSYQPMPDKRERSRRAGTRFQNLVTQTLQRTCDETGYGWYMRITDRMTVNWTSKRVVKHATPHDHILVTAGVNLLIECKVVYGGDRFTFGRVKQDQFDALVDFTLASEISLGVVFFSYMEFRKRPDHLFILPVWELLGRPLHIKRGELGRAIDTGVRPGEALPLSLLVELGEMARNGNDTLYKLSESSG